MEEHGKLPSRQGRHSENPNGSATGSGPGAEANNKIIDPNSPVYRIRAGTDNPLRTGTAQ